MAQARHPTEAILGRSSAIVALREQIRRLAAFDAVGGSHVPTLLLQGETGTGKGLIARVVHDSGPRASGAFIDVNCGAIPEAMLEAELFGFEAGAFTDARRAKPGLFEAASGGTLFLDEIDSLSRPVQSKVLKAIEEKRTRRLGAVQASDLDVKLIAATQRNLLELVEAEEFRGDLYHRLAVLILEIPPLRERRDDVVALAEHFLRTCAEAHGLSPRSLEDSGVRWLRSYAWPGNVRELGHLMERVILLGTTASVGAEALQALCVTPAARVAWRDAPPAPARAEAAGDEEGARIRAALEKCGGNVVRAARLLGIGRNALRYRMRRLGVERPSPFDSRELVEAPPASAAPAPEPAATAPAPRLPSWEQKPAAVLTVSLVLPEAAEPVDYDLWTQTVHWERAVTDRLEGFGGVLVQRSALRFTAVFGVPRALEQTVQRAVQAALSIQQAVARASPRPEARAAVHVGEVRIDTSAPTPLSRLLPLGDAFALSERLLGHAGAGEVLLSAPAARRVERTCELEERALRLGPGDGDRLSAFVASARAAPAATATAAGGAPAFVGREREVSVLLDCFARAAAGSGQVVFVAGEAGIGKSRLLGEFRARLAGRPQRWIEGRCASYAANTPFLPIIDGLRRHLEIDDRDDARLAAAKVEQELDRLGGGLGWTRPHLEHLLSLDVSDENARSLDSASRRSELFRALQTLTVRAAEIEPLVVVVEDLHWIDPLSEEYLDFLQEVIPGSRLLLLLSHRTGYRAPFADRSYHQRISLSPLSGPDVAVMTDSILGTSDIPIALRELIAGKAEGNPFFVEELSHSLLEEGAVRRENGRIVLARDLADIAVPETIQDVLIARIDRLEAESRRAMQVASVIGREFALRLLAKISESGERIRTHVEELRSLELIYEKALHPELAYMFKHALTHDVAYESVLADGRKALHAIIGAAIEELYADRLAEHYETLAHHFGRAERWEKALRYHELSAAKAAETHANRAVVEHCRQALAIADRLGGDVPDEVRCRLNDLLARACYYLSEYAASGAAYEEAAARASGAEAQALYLGAAAFSFFYAHRYDLAQRHIAATLERSRAERLPAGEAMALLVRGFYRGVHDADLDGYDADTRAALAICARNENPAVEGWARMNHVIVAEWTGEYDAVGERAAAAMALGRRLRRPEMLIFPSWFLGKARCCLGDYGGALALLEEALQLCERIGDRAWKSRLLNTIGWCFAEIGSADRARPYNERAAAVARDIGDPEILANADVNLAFNHLEAGDVDRALSYLEPIEAAIAGDADRWMLWRYTMHVRHARARVELARRMPERTVALAAEEVAAARRHRAPKIEARALALRARALLQLGESGEADADALGSLALASRIGYRRGLCDAHRLLAEVAVRLGDVDRAREHVARARALTEAAARTLADDGLRARLLATAPGEP